MKIKAILLIFFVTFIVYSNSLGGEFVYDDDYFIAKNVSIKSLGNIVEFFTSPSAVAFSELSRDVYRPVTALSYSIDYFLMGLNTLMYHLSNTLFHSLNAILVFLFIYAVFGDYLIALFAGLFFACHPVLTEAVSWVSGRSSVLCLFFYLAALLGYVKFIRSPKPVYLALSLASFAVSLFAREMAASLPLILMAYDFHFFNKDGFRKKALRYLPYVLMALFFMIVRFIVLKRLSQCAWWGGTPYHNFLSMLPVITGYIGLLLFPVNLCALYVNKVYMTIAHTEVLVSLAILASLAAAMPFIYKKSRRLSFCVSWFFITLLPMANVFPIRALMAERFLYMPSIAFAAALAIFIRRVAGKARIAAITAALIVTAYSLMTIARNEDWKDAVRITESIIKVSPVNPWAYASLGAAYAGRGRYEEAIKELRKSISLSRDYPAPRSILGFCYLQMERYEDAVYYLGEALEMNPDNLETVSSLGVALAKLKRYDEAIKQFEDAKKKDPYFVGAYLNMGAAYEFMGEYDKALAEYRVALTRTRSVRDIAVIYIRFGDVYVKMKDVAKARSFYSKALETCNRGADELKKVARARLTAEWKE